MVHRPRARALEPIKLPPENGSPFPRFVLRDSAALSPQQLIVSLPALYLVELADGRRTIPEIISSIRELSGVVVEEKQVLDLLETLDQQFLLDNERARNRLAEISPRPLRHAAAYPQSDHELLAYLDDLLGADEPKSASSSCRASLLPHIDFLRGRDSYRAGYQHLQGLKPADQKPLTVVILGISHAFCRTPFILTEKSFQTPLGIAETDKELVEKLARGLPFDPYLDEYNHMGEHSVEFHAVLLKRLAPNLRIVPVLCRSFFEAIKGGFSPLKIPGVAEFLENLETLRDERPDIHFLASVDLAHMGLNFGGERLTREFLGQLENRDRESLAGVEAGRADDFFSTHQKDQGERNYCGTPAIYTLLHLFPEPFALHNYQQCTDPDLGSTVTVASATLQPSVEKSGDQREL